MKYLSNAFSQLKKLTGIDNNIAYILMLHRVSEKSQFKLAANENMKVSPYYLEKFIKEHLRQGYKFISLDQMCNLLSNNPGNNKKHIVITLDDGYKDNYEKAFPIFKKYNIPFCIYISTSFPEGTSFMWWYILENLILQENKIILNDGTAYICDTEEKKEKTFLALRQIIMRLDHNYFEERFLEFFSNYDLDNIISETRNLAMSWSQIKEISSNKLSTIGSHTHTHRALKNLSLENMKSEIRFSLDLLNANLETDIKHFSFPYGTRNEANKVQFELTKEFNFLSATTTNRGSIIKSDKYRLNQLPRIMLTENSSIVNLDLHLFKENLKRRCTFTLS